VSQFSLATSRQWNDHTGAKQERTEWHRCIAWQGLSDIVERYVVKGQRLYVEGTVEYRAWQDKEGQTRYSTEINIKELIMLSDGRRAGSNGQQQAGAADTDFPFGANAGTAEPDPFEDDAPAPAPAAKKRVAKKTAGA
jgi:single-strand DNA-binding protein